MLFINFPSFGSISCCCKLLVFSQLYLFWISHGILGFFAEFKSILTLIFSFLLNRMCGYSKQLLSFSPSPSILMVKKKQKKTKTKTPHIYYNVLKWDFYGPHKIASFSGNVLSLSMLLLLFHQNYYISRDK